MSVNSIDILFAVILFAGLIHGYLRGFALELITLICLVVMAGLAVLVTNSVGGHFAATAAGAGGAEVVGNYQPIMAFMFGGLFACGLLFALFIARKIAGPTALMGFGSHFIGMILGLVCGAILAAAVIYDVQFTAFRDDANWQNSKVVNLSSPYVEMVTTKLTYNNLVQGAASN